MVTISKIWHLLEEVKDPEIPVLSVVELGMINDVTTKENQIIIDLTPTFTACPAITHIKDEIAEYLEKHTKKEVEIKVSVYPPWSSNKISNSGLKKLKEFGITPPKKHDGNVCFKLLQKIQCPYCNSNHTLIRSNFGSTLCRSMHYCKECKQSFEHFKSI